MSHGQAVFLVFAAVVAVVQLTLISMHLGGIRDGLTDIRGELARLRKLVP